MHNKMLSLIMRLSLLAALLPAGAAAAAPVDNAVQRPGPAGVGS